MNSYSREISLILEHKTGTENPKKTEVKVRQYDNESSEEQVSCAHCDEQVDLFIRSKKTIRMKYILVLLPSIIIGGYFIIRRTLDAGLESLLVSVITYIIVGLIAYLFIILSIFKSSFTEAKVVNSSTHQIGLSE